MQDKKFKLWNRLAAAAALVISAITYLSTIEPSASFWDCGEFIASSYKLEVGHPPGNPTFQLIARLFTMFGDNMHAAVLVNAMSALCSALTIFFLYLTIVWFAKRLVRREGEEFSISQSVAIIGSGLVGALAYCFSDTFWFSAVEGEVYAMSSLFTALVFWAMTRWYDVADERYANRWIVLIALLMGLSIGVHLLNLLMIPALVFMYYYRKREDRPYTAGEYVKIFLIGVAILALVLFVIIPLMPKAAAYCDLVFVNWFGLPYNTGAAFFLVAVLALCFWGLFDTLKKKKVFWNTALLCLTSIIIGFSIFSIDIIRSCAKTPTNEYQPDNAFTLVRYLSREQYGSTPLLYGQYFDAQYDIETSKYWAPVPEQRKDGATTKTVDRYRKVDGPGYAKYRSDSKMLFPRMWSSADPRGIEFYTSYTGGKGSPVRGAQHRKPTMGANLRFFFDYQLGWMYWRYFMWNFVGRQNDVHGSSQNLFYGNWESGVKFIDQWRLGDQSGAPAVLVENKGKNHYYFLPFLLGLLGLCFQCGRDKRGGWLNFLMFFMTGIAIVVYLNQPPFQVRERDYAYAGSFYFFSVWIGLAVLALWEWVSDALKGKGALPAAACISALCLCVPALMAAENWDDHDRSHRATAAEIGYDYLNSTGEQGILITHGDNDTFPLWYSQEVEETRPDVRVVNTSLLGTDWHIDQMKWACNDSRPLDLCIGPMQYLYGTNEMIPIYDPAGKEMSISEVIRNFRDPKMKVMLGRSKVDFICARRIVVPVNKENALRSGLVSPQMAERMQDSIVLEISKDKNFLTKPELFMLDLLANYKWDRPISLLNMGGDLNVGIKDYLEYQGYSCRLVPWRNHPGSTNPGIVDTENLWRLMTEVYRWDALKADKWFIDYQNCYTFMGVMSIRALFANCAEAFIAAGQKDRALAMLAKSEDIMWRFPLSGIPLGFSGNDYMVVKMIDQYYRLGCPEKAKSLASEFAEEVLGAAGFYLDFYDVAKSDFELCGNYIYYLSDTMKEHGDAEAAAQILERFKEIVKPV